jgi:hypothetical protein
VKFYIFLPPMKETSHNTSPAFKQAYPIRASVASDEIIRGSAEPEPNNPSGILLPNHRLHSGIVSG